MKLLVLGSSGVVFANSPGAATLPGLIADELARLHQEDDWQVEAALLYPAANMALRVDSYLDRFEPDMLLLTLGATAFAEESVMYAIRRRHPRLYPLAERLISGAKRAAGGAAAGSPSLRGATFRVPSALARRVFGLAPMIELDVALRATIEALELIASRATPCLCRLANGHFQHAEQAAVVSRRTEVYNGAVTVACERLGIPWYAQRQALMDAGLPYELSEDGLHTDFETRRRVAALAAARITEVVNSGAVVRPR
jgi:hypothetical protein